MYLQVCSTVPNVNILSKLVRLQLPVLFAIANWKLHLPLQSASMETHTCNPSTPESEAGGSQVSGQIEFYSKDVLLRLSCLPASCYCSIEEGWKQFIFLN